MESMNLTIKNEPILESDPEMDVQQERQLVEESIEVIVKEEPVFESIPVPTMKEEESLDKDELDILPVKVESNDELTDDEYILGLGEEETANLTLTSHMDIDQGGCHKAKASGSSLSKAHVECRNLGTTQNERDMLSLKVESNDEITTDEYILGLGDTQDENMTLSSSEKNVDQTICNVAKFPRSQIPLIAQQRCTNQRMSKVPTEQYQHHNRTNVEEYDRGNILEYEQKIGKLTKHCHYSQCKTMYDNSGECSKSLNQNMNDETHIRAENEKNYKCIQCGKCYTKKSNLKTHIRMHTGEKINKCDDCGRCFAQRGHLEAHLRIHTGEKNYKCDECGKCFSRNSDLKMHIRIHTGAKDYKCEVCGMCFYKSSSLIVHFRIHSGERNYKCDECGKSFKRRCHLRTHLLIHSGEKNYKCEECGRCFSQRSNLKTHCSLHAGKNIF